MDITVNLKRASLDDAYDAATAAAVSPALPDLRAQLRSYESAARNALAGGSLASIDMNGRSTSYARYGAGQLTPVQSVELWRELIDLFDSIKACQTAQSLPTDAATMRDAMMSHTALQTITESYPDMTYLRLPAVLTTLT